MVKELTSNFLPEPLFREISEPSPFPVEALGDILGPIAKALTEIVKAPDALCAQSILAAASLAAQGQKNIEIDGRIYPLSDNFITIAESGERKTGVDKIALLPHRTWEKSRLDNFDREQEDYNRNFDIYKRAKSHALSMSKKQKKISIPEMDSAIRELGDPPRPPVSQNLLIEEPTYEGLVNLLKHNQPSVGIFSDEGGRFVGGHAMNEENSLKTLAGLSSLWDGSPITRSRAGDGTSKLYGRRLSMHLMIQPTVANSLFGNEMAVGQGFISRCLVAWPKSTVGTRNYQTEDITERREFVNYSNAIRGLLNLPLPLSSSGRCQLDPISLKLSEDAYNRWIIFHNSIEIKMGREAELSEIRAFGSKCGEHVLRLAGTLTVLSDPARTIVSLEQLESAIQIIEYYISESIRLNGFAKIEEESIRAKQLLDWLVARGEIIFVASSIYQCGPQFLREKKATDRYLKILEIHGFIKKNGPYMIDGVQRKESWSLIQI